MKKYLALLLVAAMLIGAVACAKLAAEAPKTEEPAKSTEAPKAEEPKANEPAAAEEPKITDGVWTCASDATHFVLVKFKEDGTFYARGLMGQKGFFGKYEVVDTSVEYYDAHEDGVVKGEDAPFDVLKSEKAVKFMHDDGTPFEVRGDSLSVKINDVSTPLDVLNTDLGKEYCALTENMLHLVAFDDYPRSLTHKPNEKFTEADEIRNLLYKFMVAEVSEKNAAEGWKQQELTLELYHNGYVDMATGDELVDEPYQKIEGNVFTLADGATVTVDPDAYTAVYQKGDVKIDFVKFNENGSEAAAAIKAQYEGEAFSGKVKLVAKMFDDGTIVIYGNDKELSKGTYEGAGLPTITLDKGTAKIKATSATDVKLIFTADLGNGQESDYELAKVEVTAEAPAAPAAIAQYEGEAFSGKVKLVAKMFDDKTIVIYANDNEFSKGTYEGQGLPTITLDKGTAQIKATSATDVKLVFTVDLGNGQESDYELAKVEVTAEAAAPTAAEPAVVAQYEGEAFSGKVKLVAKMFDDGTIVICGNDTELTRGTYEGQGIPTITLEKGTAEIKATSATDVKLIVNIDLGNGTAADYTLERVNN